METLAIQVVLLVAFAFGLYWLIAAIARGIGTSTRAAVRHLSTGGLSLLIKLEPPKPSARMRPLRQARTILSSGGLPPLATRHPEENRPAK
jgi:hypothetical protein